MASIRRIRPSDLHHGEATAHSRACTVVNTFTCAATPRESMPEIVQNIMLIAPTTHFVELSQAILYRGAGLETVWQPFLALALIGTVLFSLSLARFRKTIGQMA